MRCVHRFKSTFSILNSLPSALKKPIDGSAETEHTTIFPCDGPKIEMFWIKLLIFLGIHECLLIYSEEEIDSFHYTHRLRTETISSTAFFSKLDFFSGRTIFAEKRLFTNKISMQNNLTQNFLKNI